jgi:chromate transporter
MQPPDRSPAPPTLRDLAVAFTVLSLSGFGGVAPQARYHLVTRRGWLTEREFADVFGISQILPGANISNLAAIVGDRFAGLLGVVVCLAALCLPSLVVAVALMLGAIRLTAAFPRFGAVETGITAATAGMIFANGLRVVVVTWRRTSGPHPAARRLARVAIALATLALIALLAVPLPVAILGMLALSVLLERGQRP